MILRNSRALVAVLAVTLLSACAELGLAPAESLDHRWAYAMATVTAARSSSTEALRTGQITIEDHRAVLALTDQARALLDLVEKNRKVDVPAAEQNLMLATTVLNSVTEYLRTRRTQKGGV